VLRQGLTLAGIGIAVGVLVALFLSRWLQSLVFEIRVTDPFVFGGAGACLAGVALLAAYLPAMRAVRVDPVSAFKAN